MPAKFDQRCYDLLKKIPKGKVTTYSEIARALNSTAHRAVGSAMAKNEKLITIPCHRVVRKNGDVGEYALGQKKKIELLQSEGIKIENARVSDLQDCLHSFA